nr:cytochrome p450 monooxygenase mpade [Quercus suber]
MSRINALPYKSLADERQSKSRFKLPMAPFLQPSYPGRTQLIGPSFSFLIEHPSHKPILFDLAIRKDWDKLPSYPKFVEKKWEIDVPTDVATILKQHKVDVDGGAIDAIIWSHHHWDHTGDPSTFPGSTTLVVGPGFKDAHLPGYPKREEATLLETDVGGREVRELDFEKEGNGLKIGRFNAYDYFGDGSFYLLDTPGHSVGHMCGLARTSATPDSFIFMGGDASHHGGEFRPTEYLPLPRTLQPSPLKQRSGICPGHLFQEVHPRGAADKPFYHVTKIFAHDKDVADWTIAGLGEFDAHESVLLLLAHDNAVVDPAQFDFYPQQLSDWRSKGVAAKVKWLFLEDLEGAVESKQQGEPAFTWDKEYL